MEDSSNDENGFNWLYNDSLDCIDYIDENDSECLNMSLNSVLMNHPIPLSPKESVASQNSYNLEDDQIGDILHQVDRPVENYQNTFNQELLQSNNTNVNNYPQMRIDQNRQNGNTIDLYGSRFAAMSQGKSQQCLRQQVSVNIDGRKRKTITRNLSGSSKSLRQEINKVFTKGCKNKNIIRKEILIQILNITFKSLHLPKVTRDESRCITDLYNNRALYANQIMAYIHDNLQDIKKQINFNPKGKKASN